MGLTKTEEFTKAQFALFQLLVWFISFNYEKSTCIVYRK